jgi:RHH-type proline utilization regulon transcriptional repressor/proline dehydrogenase/delta 1-pyrroline-5-carboxylate dehydrogenase
LGQDNLLRYRPYDRMVLRVSSEDQLIDIMRVVAAAKICGTKLQISSESKIEGLMSVIESEETLASRVREGEVKRIRMIGNPGAVLALSPCDILTGPVLASGRLELLHYLREVSISIDYHRYRNLGDREQEKRSPLPESK